jgi:PAS domain S-box-containing protein
LTQPPDFSQIRAAQARLQQIQQQSAAAHPDRERWLAEAIAELATALEELTITTKDLHQQNAALLPTQSGLEAERQHYQNLFNLAPEVWSDLGLDSSDHKQTKVDLRQSEQKFRIIFDGTNQFIGLLTPTGLVVDANRAALAAIAADRGDVIGRPFWETPWWTHSPPLQEQLKQAINHAAHGELVRFEAEHILANHTTMFVDFSLTPSYDSAGTVIMLIAEGRDITDRKRSQAERQQADQKIREQAALLDIASDAIFVRNLDHRILYWNQGAERLYGWRAAEAIGQPADQLLQEDPAQIKVIRQTLSECGEWQGEVSKVTKTGQSVIVAGRWTLVRDETGRPKFILSVNTDITAQKNLEAQFYHAQRLESLGTLASGIAHDLNNVLTPILTLSQLLQLQQPALDARSQEMLRIVETSARRGGHMVKQILTFARGSEGDRRPVQIADLLPDLVKVVQQTFPKSIVIRQHLPASALELVNADATQLHQVLMNLCVNARDAMPHGGVLTIAAENYAVDPVFAQMVLDAQVGNYVLITITDTGVGMSSAVRDRIFEPFFTTKAPGQGTGLGLATVLGIVKNHSGFVQVTSAIDKGSQFKVYLPTTTQPTVAIKPIQPQQLGQGELVLIVDDDQAVQRANQSMLKHNHYTTLVANDGIAAITLYAQHQQDIQVVLMDIMMPNLDGIMTIRTLKKINPQAKIIAMSGLSAHREPVLAAGAQVFLTKPYTLPDLLQQIANLINDKSAIG